MSAYVDEKVYLSFVCPSCRQEIEAPAEMADKETVCPACASLIRVPTASQPGTLWRIPLGGDTSPLQAEALKGRTIRIELDSW